MLAAVLVLSCSKDVPAVETQLTGFPNDVGKIMVTKCAIKGCHDNVSKASAGGFSLETWADAFAGGNGGACIIPFRPDYSTLCYYTNINPDFGPTLIPTMPFNGAALSQEEYLLLQNWILAGAPNNKGEVKFASSPRKKYYVTNQGCDVVTVFDANTNIAMRYINVGAEAQIESPHYIKVSADQQFWCVSFIAGRYFQKYSTADDRFLAQADIGIGSWNTFALTADSKKAYVIDWTGNKIVVVNLETMSVITSYAGIFNFPHGSYVDDTRDVLYVTSNYSNFIHKIDVSDPLNPQIEDQSLDLNPPTLGNSLDPHEVITSPTHDKIYVACMRSNEVRVLKIKPFPQDDSLLAVVPTGITPLEMAYSIQRNLLFVTCMEDTVLFYTGRGCVTVIDMNTNTVVKNINVGYQPHGLAVDDYNGVVYVASRNYSSTGPAPHHSSSCGGRNGFVTTIDINTLELKSVRKQEVAVDPYGMAIKQ